MEKNSAASKRADRTDGEISDQTAFRVCAGREDLPVGVVRGKQL